MPCSGEVWCIVYMQEYCSLHVYMLVRRCDQVRSGQCVWGNVPKSVGQVINLAHAGRGYNSHSVCLSVCDRSSRRYAYSTGPTKVPKESARHKDQNKGLKHLSSKVMTVDCL